MRRLISVAAVLLLAWGCATATAPPPKSPPAPASPSTPPAPAAPAPSPAGAAAAAPVALSSGLHWVRNSAEYRALALTVYRQALAAVERRSAGKAPGTWAVGLDVDDTVLDNSLYAKEREVAHVKHTALAWGAWVKRRERTAVPGASHFLHAVHDLGGRIAIVTNTIEELCDDTEANLQAVDLPHDVLLCRPLLADDRKEERWRKIAYGTAKPGLPPLEILVWVGDNIQDFPDQSQELRQQPDSAFADFGERFFVLPNPVYGSWMTNPQQ